MDLPVRSSKLGGGPIAHRSFSYDRTGDNADARPVGPGDSIPVLDEARGQVSRIWLTIADKEKKHLKRIVLRMYWDREGVPSVEAPDR